MPPTGPSPTTELRTRGLQAFRNRGRRVARLLGLEHWFPHVPLALAAAGLGLRLLSIAYNAGLRQLIATFPAVLQHIPPTGMPFLLIGVALLLTSPVLVLRTRLGWSITLLLAIATIFALRLLPHVPTPLGTQYAVVLAAALLLARRSFTRTSVAAGTLFAITSSLVLLIYAVFGSLYLGAQFHPPVTNLTTAFYYSIVTMSTVGYGDITPATSAARLFTLSIIVLGITIFATSISAIIGPLVTGSLNRIVNRKETRMPRSDHFVIVGMTPLAINTYRELKRRHQPVVVIAPQQPPDGDFDADDVIVGDANNLEILQKAHAGQARAVMALRNDDSENAFVALTVKELKGQAKTVVAVNESKHMERVKLVQPDIIISPQVLGGEILAMALSGERISGEFLLERFLNIRPEGTASS